MTNHRVGLPSETSDVTIRQLQLFFWRFLCSGTSGELLQLTLEMQGHCKPPDCGCTTHCLTVLLDTMSVIDPHCLKAISRVLPIHPFTNKKCSMPRMKNLPEPDPHISDLCLLSLQIRCRTGLIPTRSQSSWSCSKCFPSKEWCS